MKSVVSARADSRLVLVDSRLFISGGYVYSSTGTITTPDAEKLFILSPLTTVRIASAEKNSSDGQCILNPGIFSCVSVDHAINHFSSYNGLKQEYLISGELEYLVSNVCFIYCFFIQKFRLI